MKTPTCWVALCCVSCLELHFLNKDILEAASTSTVKKMKLLSSARKSLNIAHFVDIFTVLMCLHHEEGWKMEGLHHEGWKMEGFHSMSRKYWKFDLRDTCDLSHLEATWILIDPGLFRPWRKEWERIWNPTMFVDPAYSSLLNNKDT